jgi:hypothetical protein
MSIFRKKKLVEPEMNEREIREYLDAIDRWLKGKG